MTDSLSPNGTAIASRAYAERLKLLRDKPNLPFTLYQRLHGPLLPKVGSAAVLSHPVPAMLATPSLPRYRADNVHLEMMGSESQVTTSTVQAAYTPHSVAMGPTKPFRPSDAIRALLKPEMGNWQTTCGSSYVRHHAQSPDALRERLDLRNIKYSSLALSTI